MLTSEMQVLFKRTYHVACKDFGMHRFKEYDSRPWASAVARNFRLKGQRAVLVLMQPGVYLVDDGENYFSCESFPEMLKRLEEIKAWG